MSVYDEAQDLLSRLMVAVKERNEALAEIKHLKAEVKRLRAALGIVVGDHEAGLLCCKENGNTAEVVRICREALEGKEVIGL